MYTYESTKKLLYFFPRLTLSRSLVLAFVLVFIWLNFVSQWHLSKYTYWTNSKQHKMLTHRMRARQPECEQASTPRGKKCEQVGAYNTRREMKNICIQKRSCLYCNRFVCCHCHDYPFLRVIEQQQLARSRVERAASKHTNDEPKKNTQKWQQPARVETIEQIAAKDSNTQSHQHHTTIDEENEKEEEVAWKPHIHKKITQQSNTDNRINTYIFFRSNAELRARLRVKMSEYL